MSESFLEKRKNTWTDLTSGANSFRFAPQDTFYDISGHCYFPSSDNQLELLAYSNSSLFSFVLQLFNSTMHCQVGDVARVPYLAPAVVDKQRISDLSQRSLDASKADWDSLETSWDFKRHPLL